MQRNSILLTVSILLFIGGLVFFLLALRVENVSLVVNTLPSPTQEVILSPTAVLQVSPTTIEVADNAIDDLQQAFAKKYKKEPEDAMVSIDKREGDFISGGIKFQGEMGGGWYLAAKKDNVWQLVADGNGTVMCDSLEGYDFPVSIVPECYDEANQKLIER
jgi:hypothetical protein